MGLFSSIFGKSDADEKVREKDYEDDEDDDEEEDEENPRPRSNAIPKLSKGMDLVVAYAESGKMLLSGRVLDAKGREVTLERSPGAFAFDICPEGTVINIRGYLASGPVDLKGVVKTSTRISFTVKDLAVIPHDELRNNFRLPLDVPVSFYYQDDVRFQNPEKCQLVNISTGGACIDSEFIHTEGEILRLRLQVEEYAPMSFLGQIIRVDEPRPGIFRYGFLFAQLDEQEASRLTRLLFNLQVGNRKRWERDRTAGNWG